MDISEKDLRRIYERCKDAVENRKRLGDVPMTEENTFMVADWVFVAVYESLDKERRATYNEKV